MHDPNRVACELFKSSAAAMAQLRTHVVVGCVTGKVSNILGCRRRGRRHFYLYTNTHTSSISLNNFVSQHLLFGNRVVQSPALLPLCNTPFRSFNLPAPPPLAPEPQKFGTPVQIPPQVLAVFNAAARDIVVNERKAGRNAAILPRVSTPNDTAARQLRVTLGSVYRALAGNRSVVFRPKKRKGPSAAVRALSMARGATRCA